MDPDPCDQYVLGPSGSVIICTDPGLEPDFSSSKKVNIDLYFYLTSSTFFLRLIKMYGILKVKSKNKEKNIVWLLVCH